MRKLIILASLVGYICAPAWAISRGVENQIKGVRLDDVVKFLPNEVPELKGSLPTIKAQLARLLDINDNILEIQDLFFNDLPEQKWLSPEVTLPVTAFLNLENSGYTFVKGSITIDGKRIYGRGFETISLDQTNFEVQVGLIDRKVIIEDYSNRIKMVFPLGVGAFDEGVQNIGSIGLVTPRFQNAWLDKREAYAARTKPTYFAGKPFLRITTSTVLDEGYTTIGFHAQPNLGPFLRGFDSHGCMRMQTEDLIAFHRLLSAGPQLQIPIRVLYYNYDQADHPAPKVDSPYKTIYNVGTRDQPYFKLDSDELIQLGLVKGRSAPTDRLQDSSSDDYFDLYNYDSRERLIPADGIPMRDDSFGRIDDTPSRPPRVIRGGDRNDLPGVSIIRGGRSEPREPRVPRTTRRQVDIGAYCRAKFPYDRVFFNWERDRLIREYNSCVKSVMNRYRSSGEFPSDIFNY